MFPKDFPEKLRSSILTSQVVGKRVKLKQHGKEFQGLCPFHNEKTPSFTVNDIKGFYHCFGCAAHGDIISFTMNSEGLDFKDAVTKLADDFSIPIPQIKADEVFVNKLDREYLLLEKCAAFFEKNLYEAVGVDARNYLKKRRLNSTIAKKFRLGFAPNSYDALNGFLLSEGFSEGELLRSGIIGKNDKGKVYDKFRGRVIFPIADKKNRIIAFGGRTLGDDLPKYLNSAETEVFKKNQTLYNFGAARKSIYDKGFAIVVEGYMDAISLVSAGVENVVAGLGTALGAEHLKELFYTTDKIVICLDGDSAGIRAAKRVSEIALPLINSKKNLAFVFLPNQMDPDDFIKEFGTKEFDNLLNLAMPLSESLFEFALQELGVDKTKKISAENKAKIENNLSEKIAEIKDAALKKYFLSFFKDSLFRLGSPKQNQQQVTRNFTQKTYAKPKQNTADNFAKNIIALIVKFPELSSFRDDIFDISELHFMGEKMTKLKDELLSAIENNESDYLEAIKSAEFSTEIYEIKNLLARFGNDDLELATIKLRILLLKDLLSQVEVQYQEALSAVDEISTHVSAITDQKIKEIFNYKNSLSAMIMALEKQII
jgi:DNA primase